MVCACKVSHSKRACLSRFAMVMVPARRGQCARDRVKICVCQPVFRSFLRPSSALICMPRAPDSTVKLATCIIRLSKPRPFKIWSQTMFFVWLVQARFSPSATRVFSVRHLHQAGSSLPCSRPQLPHNVLACQATHGSVVR